MTKSIPHSIKETHRLLKEKEISAVNLVEIYFENIEKNKDLNAFITNTYDYAIKKAKETDRIINDNPNAFSEFPLLGVTMALKDLYLTKGIRTTAASNLLDDFIPQYSASVFNKLEDAGAILVGKTNCDAWAHGASGENSDFGVTKNPWNKDYVPGGSSSGSAVSVATDMSLIAMGTDTGGSIRQPASFCGVVGFKPTFGVVSRFGVIAMASSLDSMGHFTNNVEDSEKIFEITKGKDGLDATLQDKSVIVPKNIKIGIPKQYFEDGLSPDVRNRVLDAKNEFEKMGHEIVEVSLPMTKYAISVYYVLQTAEVSSNLGRFDGVRFGKPRSFFGMEAKRRIMLGTFVLSSGYFDAYYKKAQIVRQKIVEDFKKIFSEVDVLLSPVSPTPAFRIGEKALDPLSMYLADVYTVSANLAGIPGLSIPCGFSDNEKLPIGFQLLGDHFSENTLFKLGKDYQEKTNWHSVRAINTK